MIIDLPSPQFRFRRKTQKGDLRQIVAIEKACFIMPWTAEYFRKVLKHHATLITLAETENGQVAGFCIYRYTQNTYEIINLAMHPNFRRRCGGSYLVEKIDKLMEINGRKILFVRVPESNLGAQLFFKARNFKATKVLPGFFGDEDGFHFERLNPYF